MKKRINSGRFMTIYLTKNLINGKEYIGQHVSNNEIDNYFGSGILLNKALKKYGRNNFVNGVIEYCTNEEELNEKEEFWIKELNTLQPNGYNISASGYGNGTRGVEPWNKGKTGIYSKETIEKMVAPLRKINIKGMQGRPCSEETKRKIGAANKINNTGEKNGMFGKKHTDESRKKMSENMKGRIPWNKGKKKGA